MLSSSSRVTFDSGSGCCWRYIQYCTFVHMKTMIDLDDEALALAAKELGTATKKDTVNAALNFVANRRRRIEQLLDDPYALGVGPDITDPEVMRQARR
jgi:Arc/MetJ family transcription regulator